MSPQSQKGKSCEKDMPLLKNDITRFFIDMICVFYSYMKCCLGRITPDFEHRQIVAGFCGPLPSVDGVQYTISPRRLVCFLDAFDQSMVTKQFILFIFSFSDTVSEKKELIRQAKG